MKTKTLILTAIFSLGMVFQGCEKEETITNKSLSDSKNISSINKSTSPSGNPISSFYNDYGAFHNDALDFIAANPNFPNLTNYEILDISKSYAVSVFGGIDSLALLDSSTINYNLNPFKSISTSATDAYNNSKISNSVKNYLLVLESQIYNYFNSYDFQNLITYLHTFENAVYNDNGLIDEEKELIISSSVIVRYSTTYWTNVNNNTSHPWYNILINTDISELPQDVINNLPPPDNTNELSIPGRISYDFLKYVEYTVDCPPPSSCDCGGLNCRQRSWIGAEVASGYYLLN